jgi:hypothetical protein
MQRLPRIYCYNNKNGMKHPSAKLPLLAILLYLAACTKKAVSSNDPAGSAGKWNLVNDSTFEGVGPSNHSVDYTGQAGDYFSFSTNGHVYTKEGELRDTLTYRLVSDSSIIISGFGLIVNGVPDSSIITGLGANSLIASIGVGAASQVISIESPFFLTPGGEFWRKVTLSR